ncbi:MAG: response regulator [Bacteroidota bacterium]
MENYQEIIIALIKILPSLFLYLIIAILLIKLYKPFKNQLLPKLTNFKAFGLEVGFLKEELKATTKHYGMTFNDNKGHALLERLERYDRTRVISILWIDDNLNSGRKERKILSDLGISCYQVVSSEEAMEELQKRTYDVVISDIYRESNPSEGTDFLSKAMTQNQDLPPFIFSIANYEPERGTPPYAFGITNQPVELFHLILDVLERKLS